MFYDDPLRIVTLTTDFGTRDGYVGAMKGVILERAPTARVIDIAHDVPRFDIAAGAYCLRQATPFYAEGTVHVAVIDPGVGTARRAVVVDNGRHLFVGPDNGVFSLVAPRPAGAWAIESSDFTRGQMSSTFHGRDVFAPAAAALAAGARPEDAGSPVELVPLLPAGGGRADTPTVREDGSVQASVIYIDGFGNLITDCPADAVVPGMSVQLPGEIPGTRAIERISGTFGEVERGQLLAYIGSAETVEVAVREGSAAHELGLGVGAQVTLVPGG